MTFIEFLTCMLVITWELEQHIFASELLVHDGERLQLGTQTNLNC